MDVLQSWPGGSWEATARLFATMVVVYLLVLWVASVIWVYRDISARTTDMLMQAISVAIAVLFPIIGLPIYVILRPTDTLTLAYDRQLEQEALLSELQTVTACPNCRRPVQDDFSVCAFCGTAVKQGCAGCGRALRLSWRVCPYCATPRTQPAEPRDAPAAEQPQPSRVTAAREAAVEAIRRAAGRPESHDDDDDDDAPRARRPAEPENPTPRPRPRPRTDPNR